MSLSGYLNHMASSTDLIYTYTTIAPVPPPTQTPKPCISPSSHPQRFHTHSPHTST